VWPLWVAARAPGSSGVQVVLDAEEVVLL
jgi:hypothetical protein